MSKELISHRGTVTGTGPAGTVVKIVSSAACGECAAAGLCGADRREKLITVAPDPYADYKAGDEVEVILEPSMGFKAVWICYAIPLVVLLGTVLVLMWLGAGELPAGLSGIGVTGVYYFIVWLFRGRLRNAAEFRIKPL